MTEVEWLACADPKRMSAHADRAAGSERKVRLFAVAACRRVEGRFAYPALGAALRVAERFADGQATAAELLDASHAAQAVADELFRIALEADADPGSYLAAHRRYCEAAAVEEAVRPLLTDALGGVAIHVASAVALSGDETSSGSPSEVNAYLARAEAAERGALAGLVRDVFGSPFRPVTADLRWLTITTVALATHIYADRAFDRLPILADALEEAGCDDADVLAHCRCDGPHVRGCWVVALVLGRE